MKIGQYFKAIQYIQTANKDEYLQIFFGADSLCGFKSNCLDQTWPNCHRENYDFTIRMSDSSIKYTESALNSITECPKIYRKYVMHLLKRT